MASKLNKRAIAKIYIRHTRVQCQRKMMIKGKNVVGDNHGAKANESKPKQNIQRLSSATFTKYTEITGETKIAPLMRFSQRPYKLILINLWTCTMQSSG